MSQSKTIAAREAALVKAQAAVAKAHASLDLAAAKATVKEAAAVKAAKKATAPIRTLTAGQQRWMSFQKFIWQQMKAVSAAVPFKEAMKEAGRRWDAGQPKLPEDAAAFDAWLGGRSSDSEEDPASDDDASVSSGGASCGAGGGGGASPIYATASMVLMPTVEFQGKAYYINRKTRNLYDPASEAINYVGRLSADGKAIDFKVGENEADRIPALEHLAPTPAADPVLAARLAAIAWRDAEIAQLEARIAVLRATPI
jgi:hypothetical protein